MSKWVDVWVDRERNWQIDEKIYGRMNGWVDQWVSR